MKLKFVSLLAEPLNHAYGEWCNSVSKVGLDIECLHGLTWQEALQSLKKGDAQVGAVCGLLYTLLRAQGMDLTPIAAPLLQHPRYEQNSPVYWADVVVRGDSDFHELEELRGKTWLYNEPGSYSGYHAFRAGLLRKGFAKDYLGPEIATGSHESSLHRLLEGEGDFTVLDSTFLDFLDPESQAQVRVLESFGPAPMPPLVSLTEHSEKVWATCQELSSLPQPISSLERVSDEQYDELRKDWNDSLQFGGDQKGQFFVLNQKAQHFPTFTSPEQIDQDRKLLGGIAKEMLSRREQEPEAILPNGPHFHRLVHHNREHHHYLMAPQELGRGNLSVVGFLSLMKPTADVKALFDVDDKLLRELSLHEGFLTYSPTEYSPGLWANLAVFSSSKARDDWASNSIHLRAIKELGPSSYDNVRLHLGVWPSLDEPLRWVATRYLSYTQEGVWRAVQTGVA